MDVCLCMSALWWAGCVTFAFSRHKASKLKLFHLCASLVSWLHPRWNKQGLDVVKVMGSCASHSILEITGLLWHRMALPGIYILTITAPLQTSEASAEEGIIIVGRIVRFFIPPTTWQILQLLWLKYCSDSLPSVFVFPAVRDWKPFSHLFSISCFFLF